MSFCRKCGNQIADDVKFCPKCGTQVEAAPQVQPQVAPQPAPQPAYTAPQPAYVAPQPAYAAPQPAYAAPQPAAAPAEKSGFAKVFSLISKIAVATLSFVMLILVLFAPVIEAPVDDEILEDFDISIKEEANVKLSGMDIITYGFLSLGDYTYEDYAADMEGKETELYEYYKKDTLTIQDVEKMIDIMEPYRYALVDSSAASSWLGEEYSANNTFLEIQFVLGTIVVLAVVVILTIATIFAILSIFKKDYSYNKSVKFWAVSMSLLFFFAGALAVSGIGSTAIGAAFGSTVAGAGLVASLVMVILMAALMYLHEVFNKNIKFNLFKVIGRGVAVVLVVASLFVLNGVFMTAKTDSDVPTTLSPSIQTQVPCIESIDDYYVESFGTMLPDAGYVVEEFYDAEPVEQHQYEALLNTFYISEQATAESGAEVMFIMEYMIFMGATIVLSFAFGSLIKGLVTDSDTVKHNANMIVCMALTLFVVILNVVLVGAFNDVVAATEETALKFSIAAGPIVAIVLLLGAVISSSILIKKGVEKDNQQPVAQPVYQAY